ncbi:hypothetical protein DZC30_05330 [Comamonas testosteroni]|uniref:Uncharacterized protein n=1 Tax=Comamonas testosteroni TaxID=285 RepID=A0A373FRQ2_COMTE|nr:hypothetical protein [Comamonas testosteroni]RGE46185.1 hypothetical protein DZC30_05330 [Comamonas testosteroni]
MHLSHITSPNRQRALRQLAVFFCPLRPSMGDVRYGQRGGLLALRQPHIARHSRVPSVYGPRKRFAAHVRALYVRIHTFYLKFLQGHT